MTSRRSSETDRSRGPTLLVLVLGGMVGLLFVVLNPPWSAGADEGTHFARAVEMAHGRLLPGRVDGAVGSPIPASYREDQDRTIANFEASSPVTGDLVGDLLESSPDWDDTVVYDTQPTTAASPLAYAPPAMAMALPDALGWPGVVVLWFGRLGCLVTYLGLTLLAVRLATAFRWSIALCALYPMNLGIGASVTPDAWTIGVLLVVLALWIRVWRPPVPAGGGTARLTVDEDRRPSGADPAGPVPTGPVPTGPIPGGVATAAPAEPALRPEVRARAAAVPFVGGWRSTAGAVALAGVGLALAKPPYFLVLAAFPFLLVGRWSDLHARAAAVAATASLAVGAGYTLLTSSGDYQAVTVTLGGTIVSQPDVQQERLLGDVPGFLWRCLDHWVTDLPATVQTWTRQLGFWRSDLPAVVAWVLLAVFVAAALVLDRRGMLALKRLPRAVAAAGTVAVVVVLYATSYVYFDDTVDGEWMGFQIARYALPLFALGLMGWAPRWPLRMLGPRAASPQLRAALVAAVVAVECVAVWAIVDVWLRTGYVSG